MRVDASFFSSFCILHSAFCIYSPPLAAIRLQYSQSLPWVILMLAVLSLIILFAYPAQLRQVPRGLGWLLPLLRMLAVFAIGFSVLRPEITRPRLAGERAPVVILFDDSASMSVIDSGRPPAEWVGIAAALGKLPADARDKKLDAVQADCDRLSAQADEVVRARAELDYSRLSGRGVDAAEARLDQSMQQLQSIARDAANASASMRAQDLGKTLAYLARIPSGTERDTWLDGVSERARNAATYAEMARVASDGQLFRTDEKVRDACRPLQSLSRLQLSEAIVLDPASGLLTRLGSQTPVLGFGVSDHVTAIDLTEHRSDPLSADGSISNLTGGLRAVLESFQTAPPRAVVLFSDGRQTGADTDAATFAALTSVPIYTVGVATRAGLKDLSITNASVVSTATVGQTVVLTAEVRDVGMQNAVANVTATGGGPDETRSVTLSEGQSINISFNRRFTDPGTQQLTLEIAPVPGEISYENNRIERWVNVSNPTTRQASNPPPATRPSMETEMADVNGDEGFLRHLSEASGGQFLRLDQVDLLPKRLNEIHEDSSHPMEIPLWDGPYLYALVLGCLAAEWGLRKRYGLV